MNRFHSADLILLQMILFSYGIFVDNLYLFQSQFNANVTATHSNICIPFQAEAKVLETILDSFYNVNI